MKLKRDLNYGRRFGTYILYEENMAEERYKNQTMNEDTKIRREMQEYIIAKKREGKSRDDVLKRLNFIYGRREPYSKYKIYFETWVDNAFGKVREQEDEGR